MVLQIVSLISLWQRIKQSRHISNLIWVFAATLSLAVLSQGSVPASIAQMPRITDATLTEVIGQQVLINQRVANTMDRAQLGERIRTTSARAELKFNTGAIGRLGTNSTLVVGSQCFQLQQGQILVNGQGNGCTNTVRAGVRGTTYLLEILPGQRTHYSVLEGELDLYNPKIPNFVPVKLKEGQGMIVSPEGGFGEIEAMSYQSYETVMTGELVKDFSTACPGLNKIKEAFDRLFPGRVFPVNLSRLRDRDPSQITPPSSCPASLPSPIQTRQNWKVQLGLSRLTAARDGGMAIQLNVLEKPLTRYANVVYQLYAFHHNRWIPIYTNTGSRLLDNRTGSLGVISERIPLAALRLEALGKRVNLDNLDLKAVVKIRYDLSRDNRDLSLEIEQREAYRNIPISDCL